MMQLQSSATRGAAAAPRRAAAPAPAPLHHTRSGQQQRRAVRARAGQRGVRGLEDFVIGGPKLRKWYGQEEEIRDGSLLAPREKGDDEPEEGGAPDVVLVTDGESPMGEQVVLQLILARAKVRMIVNDVAAAKAGYGPYVEPVSADVSGGGGLPRALRNVRRVVVLGRLGKLLPAAQQAGVEHIVLLSTAGMPQPGGLAALFGGGGDAVLKDAAREQQLAASGLPHVVVKTGAIRDVPGGASALVLSAAPDAGGAAGSAAGGGGVLGVSREDLACALARLALDVELPGEASGTVVVAAAGPGQPPADWAAALRPLVAP